MVRNTLVTTLILPIIAVGLVVAVYFYTTNNSQGAAKLEPSSVPQQSPTATPNILLRFRSNTQALAYGHFLNIFGANLETNNFNLVEPVEGFKSRITKKSFGLYITPESSPVQPDRFAGYHNGVDVEFTDTQEDIPVRAIADGTVVVRTWASGYGGVIVIRHNINGVPVFALYGHLDPESFTPASRVQVRAGQQIGVLGNDHSGETDGTRKHLHFSMLTGDKLDMRGYVQTEEELANWLNPLDFYTTR